jgi:hypothetical protein
MSRTCVSARLSLESHLDVLSSVLLESVFLWMCLYRAGQFRLEQDIGFLHREATRLALLRQTVRLSGEDIPGMFK